MTDNDEARDEEADGVELIRRASSYASQTSGSIRPMSSYASQTSGSVMSVFTPSKMCKDAKILSRATTQATLTAKTILAAGGSEDAALRTARAAAQATLLESHIGTGAFSNSKGSPSAFIKRRTIKRQSDIVASMALMSATNQVYNETDWDLLCGDETQSTGARSSKSVKFALPSRPMSIRRESLPLIIEHQELSPDGSFISKVSTLPVVNAKTETDVEPLVFEPPQSKSRSIESDRNLGLVENTVNQSLKTAIVSQDSGKESVAILSHHSEGAQSSTGNTRPPLPSSVVSQESTAVKMEVLKSAGNNENGDEGTLGEPIYFFNRGATNEAQKDGYDMTSSVDFSMVMSEADDHTEADETRSFVSNDSFFESHVDPCFFFWRCGAGEVETSKAPALMKKRLPSSRIETPRIVLTLNSDDSETVVEADKCDYESPYEITLSEEKKKFRAKLRAAAKKREKLLSAKQERVPTAEPEGRDDAECEREGQKNDDDDGNDDNDDDSSPSSCLDAGDASYGSQLSSFSKGNTKGKKSWGKLLGLKTKRGFIK